MYTTLTSNIYMTIILYKACKVTCSILCGLLELLMVAVFNHLIWEIIDAKVEENYFL